MLRPALRAQRTRQHKKYRHTAHSHITPSIMASRQVKIHASWHTTSSNSSRPPTTSSKSPSLRDSESRSAADIQIRTSIRELKVLKTQPQGPSKRLIIPDHCHRCIATNINLQDAFNGVGGGVLDSDQVRASRTIRIARHGLKVR